MAPSDGGEAGPPEAAAVAPSDPRDTAPSDPPDTAPPDAQAVAPSDLRDTAPREPAWSAAPDRTPAAPLARAEAVRYGSAMLRHFGWFYHLLGLGWLLGRVRLDEASAERIRAAAARGPVVYVLSTRSALDHLTLNTVLTRRRLPLSVWANGVSSFWWQPVVDAWADVGRRVRALFRRGRTPDPITSGWLSRTVASGAPATVFLRDRRTVSQVIAGEELADPLQAIVDAQGKTERPVQILPVVVVWNRSPVRKGPMWDFLYGSLEVTAPITDLGDVIFRSAGAFVQVGEPIDLVAFGERFESPGRAKALRALLRRALRREATVVRGPRLLPHAVMKRIVLDNPPMRELARREADATGKPPERVRRELEREFDAIAANFRWSIIQGLSFLLRPLWTRVFSGVDVRDEDLERIRAAMRQGTAVLVPSHKSHFDYVLLSWVFFANDLIVPHVVAGMNLAIWPVSILLRGAGGFFVKRSFAGERIFPAVFARYLRELIRQGYPVEFFIEGGRTRSGKLLPPRLGVLGMVLDAASHRRTGSEVTLLPIAFAYEQVAEEGAYARELGGEDKRPETMGQLVKARSVLSRRFGRVYLRVGEPVPASAIVDAAGGWEARPKADRKEELLPLGERLVYRIGEVTVVLASSLVSLSLLAHHRRGIKHQELVERFDRFRAFLKRAGALEAAALVRPSEVRTETLVRFAKRKLVESLELDGDRVWAISVEGRIQLDFYKNQVLHFFATACYAAAAIRALPPGPFTVEQARPSFLLLAWTLRREFVLDPDRPATALLREGLERLVAHGALTEADGSFDVADPARMGEIHGLLRSVLEGYVAVLRVLPRHPRLDRKELVKALIAEAPSLVGTGAVSRPEALSRVVLENAVDSLAEEGLLVRDDRDRLTADEPRRLAALDRLSPMVD